MGRGVTSRGQLGGRGAAVPRWLVAPRSRAAQPCRGRRSRLESRAACLTAGGGTRWRPRLEVEFRGLVPGDPPEGWAEELPVWPCAGDGRGGTSNRRSAFPGQRFESSRGRFPSSGGPELGVLPGPWGLTPSPTQPTSLLFVYLGT